ncbi:hypothetical protein F418_p52 [Hafnia phage Enc34]|uniref:Uncharacterized protein n=1 Tax=Hafnia phage Enc34 TaxID=1150990 RepID=H6WYL4_9CAUD|nr:hypothetical protein F418_p52 [Hafnia phage Enc34]AFB84069.1 hypothetical protein [Hafnia phage Enc34]
MAQYGSKLVVKYWQDKKNGMVIETHMPETWTASNEWRTYLREVRLLHHPESECVIVEDVTTNLSFTDDPNVIEVDLPTFNYWNLIYSNPDI